MKVAVFGGASAEPGEKTYDEALRLGALLGANGHTVMTGGYGGVMHAASRGCSESGGHVVGVTCTQIEAWRGTKANQWVAEELHFETLRERMYALIDSCDAAIVMPGGVGTLCELMVMWNEMIINGSQPRPLIVVGRDWAAVLSQFLDSLGSFIKVKDQELIQFVAVVDEAFETLNPGNNSRA